MVNSGSFDSDVDRNEKDGFTQYNHVVESPQSVISMHAVSGSLCENDFSTQTADSLPVSQAIEPTATKTEYKCNMSEDIVRVSNNLELQSGYENSGDENKCIKETCITTQSNTTQSFVAGEPFVVDQYINTGYLRKYKIETKPSICCSVPLERIPNVLKTCSNIIANRTLSSYHNNKEIISKKEMCLYCDRSFLIPSMRQKHMNRSHLLKCNKRINHKLLKCLYCDLDSGECNLKQLFTHLATKHSEKYFACLQCEMRFPNVRLLENHKTMLHSSFLRLDANAVGSKIEEKKENETVMRDPNSTIKTRIEYKRNTKTNSGSETLPSLETTPKTKRKCQSKYLHNTKPKESSDPPTISSKPIGDDTKNKIKSKYVKDLRKKKLSVISTKVGVKLGLRITRQRSKILENAKNSRKKTLPEIPTQKESNIISTKYLPPYQTNSLSFFDISYRVKKITDHSIDNLRISSLTFNDVFDKAFFNRVKCNIQENLLNYIDGKLFKSVESENRISSFQKTKDVSLEECSSSCGFSNTISNTSEASSDTQFSEDSESQVDKTSKKKHSSVEETGNFKYFTRRKYQAVISERKGNKDLSKLDIWTQLIMKNRQQKILSDQKTDKELLEYKKSDEYKTKIQREELNGILDKRGPLEDLKEEAMRTVALEKINSTSNESNIDTYFDVTIILNEILNNLFPKENNLAVSDKENCPLENTHEFSVEKIPQGEELLSTFNLQRISYSSRVNAIENVLNNDIDKTAIAELTGEWARTRIYICASCGIKLPNAKLLVDHKNLYHENVWCQHYEFVGNQGELYRHLSIPGLGKIGAIEDKLVKDAWRRSDARQCSKCNKRFNNLGDLHRHILECGGDLAWMLERKKYKYRPYGSKPRKKRRGLLRLLQTLRNHSKEKRKNTIKKFNGPRQKPSDADTIERMLANLPAKRITRKVISLKDGFSRPVINKKVIKTNVKPSKKENKIVAKTTVTVTNRTRRLLRSNSSILLDNKRSLILTKFKRKKKEKKKIVNRRPLKAQTNSVQQHFLKNNPIVATCKLTDDQIKNFVKPDVVDSSDSDLGTVNENDDKKLDDHTENKSEEFVTVEDPQVMTAKENTPLSDDAIVDHLIYNNTELTEEEPKSEVVNVTKSVRVVQKKRKIKKSEVKVAAENAEKKKVVSKQKFRNNSKVNHISSIKTRKMHLRNANTSKQTNRKKLAKATLTEIVQVDGSPHSKPVCKSKVSKKNLNDSPLSCTPNCSTDENMSILNEDDESTSIVTRENDDGLVMNTLNDKETEATPMVVNSSVEKEEVTEEIHVKDEIEDTAPPLSLIPDLTPPEDKDCNDKLLIKIPPATKKGPKKTRGLNDCIAMLTNKLQDKSLSPTNNVLENFSLKSFETSINGLLNKSTVNGINNCNVLSEYVEAHVTQIDEVKRPNGFCCIPNGIHKDISDKLIPEKDASAEVIERKSSEEVDTNFEQCFEELQQPSIDIHKTSDIPEQETAKEFDELRVNKHKVKHKRKETRKRRLFGNVSVLTNDKLQEIQDSNTLLNGTNNNLEFNKSATESIVKQDTDNANNLDKFSASEKENSFTHTIIKIIKSRKSRRRGEKEVVADVELVKTVEVSLSRNHVDDIIDSVAMNEFVDSEDELPLSELAKKYVAESKPEDSMNSPKPITSDNSTLIEPIIIINNVVEVSTVVREESPANNVNMDVTRKLQKKHVKRKKRRKVGTDIIKTHTFVSAEESVQTIDVIPDVAEVEVIPDVTEVEVIPDVTEVKVIPDVTEVEAIPNVIEEYSSKISDEELKVDLETKIDSVLDGKLASPSKVTSENTKQQPDETNCNNSTQNESDTSEKLLDVSASNDSGLSKSETPVKKKRGRKPKALTAKLVEKIDDEPSSAYCDICNKTFRRSENLLKHKRTLTHIAKLSELEALQQAQSKLNEVIEEIVAIENASDENKTNDVQTSLQNIDSVACDEFPENNKEAEFIDVEPPQESLQLVDIINNVLSEPVDSEYVEHRNFSNLILQSDPEIKRCKSLGERKSFDCDKLPIIDNSNASPIPIETNISGSTADVIVEKQISLLENMIEDNRNTFSTSQKVFDSSKLPITEDYSCQSNSSAFSILSSSKQEDLNEITFTHNTNIITNLIKPNLEDNLISTTQYEQISDDSNSSHLQIEEQKSRKALNRDEELFLECCSLLKSSSDVSDLCRKNSKPTTKFLNNFGLKPMDELEWLEQKQLPINSAILQPPINNTIEIPQTNASVHENFYNDVPYSNFETRNLKVYLEKTERENLYSRPPIFEDISTESDGSSRKSVPNLKSSDQTGFTIELNHDDRSSPNVESAQVPFEEEKTSVEDRGDDIESLDKDNHLTVSETSSPVPKKSEAGKTIQTNIMDYVVTKKIKKHENKKLLTKGALKVFEGLKVSIPKVELDMKEVLSCSPTSKRLEIEAEQDKLQEKKLNSKKESAHRNFLFNKIIKNGKKINNKLGLKITKKRYNVDTKLKQIHHEITKKSHDVYDFEETQDSVDIFIKNSDSLPDYHSFKNKITNKYDSDDFDYDDFAPKSPKDDCKKLNKNNHCLPPNILPSSRKLKMNKCITKKKCMIMGRIFKNALKSKMSEDIKNIPVMDNTKIVEDFVMNCHDMQLNHKNQKSKLSEEEMNMLFDSLLNDDNVSNSLSKCKSENTPESELNSISVKHTDKLKQRMKCKRRQRANSPDSSDEEFSIKKIPKKHLNKKTNVNNCVINLEQELKECIGVASRKSQRKCTSGKQNVLVEYWSSDESNFDFESVNSIVEESQEVITKELTSAPVEEVGSVVEVVEDKNDEVPQLEEKKEICDKVKETKTANLKSKHFKKRKIVKPNRDVNGSSINAEDNDSMTIASTRQKRNAVDTLYYWSSSSEDEMVDIIDLKAIREDCIEEDRPLQQGWIVGDSPKKLVTMLAQAKGKKLDIEYVKKNRKKRTSV